VSRHQILASRSDERIRYSGCVDGYTAIPAVTKRMVELEGGHFHHMDTNDTQTSAEFKTSCAAQVAFLKEVLL